MESGFLAKKPGPISPWSARPPDAAKTRNVLPEGTRLSESRMFWIAGVEVKPVRVGTGATEGDVIEYKGTRYRVNHVEQWPGFVEVLGVREEGQ